MTNSKREETLSAIAYYAQSPEFTRPDAGLPLDSPTAVAQLRAIAHDWARIVGICPPKIRVAKPGTPECWWNEYVGRVFDVSHLEIGPGRVAWVTTRNAPGFPRRSIAWGDCQPIWEDGD